MNVASITTAVHQQNSTTSISVHTKYSTDSVLDRRAFLVTLIIITLLSACHLYYVISSRMVPSTDEAHYMSGALSIAQGIRTRTLSGAWNGYQNALGFKPPLICLPAALLMLVMGGLTSPCMLSLVLTFVALGFASYSLFRHCLRPFHAAIATILLLSMPMITGLTHRFYVELLLILLCVVYLDLLIRQPWLSSSRSLLAGIMVGTGVLCKTTFPVLLGLPTLYSFWLAWRRAPRSLRRIRLWGNVVLAAITAFVIAAPWYAKNWKATLDHAKLAASIPICYYPHWIQADISVGPWIVVFCAAAVGLPIVIIRLIKFRDNESERSAWIMILLLGLVTALMAAITINKATRFTATWLPMLACLAVATWREVKSPRWSRYGLITTAAVSMLLVFHNSFNILPIHDIRIGDIRIIASHFPLNIPGWYDDNHPLDRRYLRLEEAEQIVAQDARAHLPPGRTAEARTTELGLLLNFDYFQLLASAHDSPVHYWPWWVTPSTSGPSAPDYILVFDGFDRLYPGVHFFNYYPGLKEDVAKRRIPYRLLSHLEGPSQTGIWIYVKEPARTIPSQVGLGGVFVKPLVQNRPEMTTGCTRYAAICINNKAALNSLRNSYMKCPVGRCDS